MTIHPLLRMLLLACVSAVALAGDARAQVPAAPPAAVAPIPPGWARIWFYRDLGIYESQSEPYIRLNGVAVGVSQPGAAFYRDVAPGYYTISADSYLPDHFQDAIVGLAAGQEAFAKILPSDPWIEGGGGGRGGGGNYRRDTFYVWLFPPEIARPQIAQSWFFGGATLTAALPPR